MIEFISKININNTFWGYLVSINGSQFELSENDTILALKTYGSKYFTSKIINNKNTICGKPGYSVKSIPSINKIINKKIAQVHTEIIPGKSLLLDSSRIHEILRRIDIEIGKLCLQEKVTFQICGSSVFHLNKIDMRLTIDIDYINRISSSIANILSRTVLHYAGGVIGLLDDYEDRLITIQGNYQSIIVQTLSIKDAIVSKLASPKFMDLIEYKFYNYVNLDDLAQEVIEKYSGTSIDRVLQDIKVLKSYKGKA